jgi:hypothetical protein
MKKKLISLNFFSLFLKNIMKKKKKIIFLNQLININKLKFKKLLNKNKVLNKKNLKLKKLKIKKLKINLKKLKINLKKLKINLKKLKNFKKIKFKNFILTQDNFVGNYLKKTQLTKLKLKEQLRKKKIAEQELKEMKHILFLKKKMKNLFLI